MNPELINIYIERLIREVGELIKSKLLIETQLKYTEMMNASLNKKIEELTSQLEKQQNKKTREKSSNTSSDEF